MILLRSLLYFLAMVMSVVVFSLLIVLLGAFLPSSFSDRMATFWGKLNLWLQQIICGLHYLLEGQVNLPD